MGKKIKISETQAYLIQDIMKEGPTVNPNGPNLDFSWHHNTLKKMATEANGLYNKLMFITMDEALKADDNVFNQLRRKSHTLFMDAHRVFKKAQFELEKLPEDEYDAKGYELESALEDARDLVTNKINVIDSICETFERLKTEYDDENWSKYFTDIQTLDINSENI